MKITVRSFSGMRPAVSPSLLAVGEALQATNTQLTGGALSPIRLPLFATTLSSTNELKTVYRFGQSLDSDTQYWFQSEADVNFIKAPLDGDTSERTYATGFLEYPSKTDNTVATVSGPYPSTSYPMGLQKPDVAPVASVVGSATDPASSAETVAYVVTLVTPWGEEGPPSTASNLVTFRAGQSISLTLPVTGVTSYPGNSDKSQPYVGKRLYRSATGSTASARFLLVNTTADIALATASYSDTAATANLGEAIRTRGWIEPPDNMLGLTLMANGVLAGYSGATVCFSEPWIGYAWPVRYQQSVDAPVVAMASFDQSILVSTTRSLYLFSGVDPAAMTSERLAVPQVCVAKRSMVSMMGGVVFATPDGLGFVGPGGFRMLSEGLMSRREWSKYVPSSIHAYESDSAYIAFFDTGVRKAGMVFRFGGESSFCETDMHVTAGFRDAGRDALYVVFNATDTNRSIQKWDAGDDATMTWESGELRLPASTNFAAARVEADGPATLTLIADNRVVAGPMAITSSRSFKLPSGYVSRRFRIVITGCRTVYSVDLASSVSELST